MLNINDILATQDMIDKRHLDIRTITMGISLLDCADNDVNVCARKIYDKITASAKDLVATGCDIEKKYGIPIVNKRVSITPVSLIGGSLDADGFLRLAHTLQRAADTLGINAAQLFRISSLDYIKLYPHALEALAKLRKAGYRLWLLSNAQAIFTAYELRLLGLGDQLDGIYLSSNYKCRKPDLRFYQALIDERHLDVSKTMMIGNDRQTDIAGAKAAGMATLYMHTDLTPRDQAAADKAKAIGITDGREYEFEGDNWNELVELILSL